MKADVLLGLQWGDEGKGKIVDVLTPGYEVIARFQGGPNAGHTLEFEGEKFVLRSIPSGIFQGDKVNIIGNGVVLDPALFKGEVEALEKTGHDLTKRLLISKKAHLILPTHRLLDACYESAKGESKIGTTGKGIGPTYTEKVGRGGLRVGDLLHGFDAKYQEVKARHLEILKQYRFNCTSLFQIEKEWFEGVEKLKEFTFVDSEYYLNKALSEEKSILAEGAQGTMLDSTGDKLRELGFEFGSVTGRPRRCGWIDLVALRYAIMINGVTQLIMMKSDVLDSFDTIKACVAYRINGNETKEFPFEINDDLTPIYKEFKGWKLDMSKMQSEEEFPNEFNEYVEFLEKELGVGITIISLGPDREQTVMRGDLFG